MIPQTRHREVNNRTLHDIVRTSFNQRGRIEQYRSAMPVRKPPITFGLRLHGTLDIEALRSALNRIGRRHDALRQYYPSTHSSHFAASIAPAEFEWPLRILDLPNDCHTRSAEDLLATELRRPFDLDKPPLLRAIVSELPNHLVLGISVDHIIFDGQSVNVFLEELSTAYQYYVGHRPPAYPALPVAWGQAAFATEEHRYLQTPDAKQSLQFWAHRWRGSDHLVTNPIIGSRAGQATATGVRHCVVRLTGDEITAAMSRHRDCVATPFVLIASALVSALRDAANTAAPNLLITVSRRYTAAANRAIGYFINRLLLSLTIPNGSAFSDIAGLTQAELLAALRNSKIPYQYLAEQLVPHRVDDILATPSILLTQFRHPKAPELPGAKAEFFWVETDLEASYTDRLSIELVEGGPDGGLELISRYNASVYEPAMIEHLMTNLAERIRPRKSWISSHQRADND